MIDPSRRDTMIALATLTGASVLPGAAHGAPSTLASAATLTQRTTAFLGGLDDGQRKAASFDWDGAQWKRWDYFGVSGYAKPGLRLEQMRAPQKDAAWSIFADVLSPSGVEKARHVMLLQDILAADGDGAGARSSERFSVSVFGNPGPVGAWGLRLEGHHLTLSFAVREGAVVSVTPAAFAAKPARVKKGPHAGLETIKGEERLARKLMADLAPKLKARAQVQDSKLFNILSTAGSERANAKKIGLAAAEMAQGQRDLLWQLIETFAVDPYAAPIAASQKARVRAGDPASVHFAWYGPNAEDKGFGYRVIGDGFVIEMGSIDGEAQHLHPVYHDLGNVLGRAT